MGIPRSKCSMRDARMGERTREFKKTPAFREGEISLAASFKLQTARKSAQNDVGFKLAACLLGALSQ
jgi:hypothetical protein